MFNVTKVLITLKAMLKIMKNKNNQNFVILLKKNQNIKCPKKPYFKIKN